MGVKSNVQALSSLRKMSMVNEKKIYLDSLKLFNPGFRHVYSMSGLPSHCPCSATAIVIGGQKLNHICYAANIFLISISSSGMQLLLNICNKYVSEHSLLYNSYKS